MKEKIRSFFSTESLIVAAVIFTAIFFAKFPTLYHWLNTPKGYWYPKNTSWFDAWDINQYVGYMRFGNRAGVLLENIHTTIPHKGVFIFQFYTFLGVLNRFLRLDNFLLFHLSSIVASILLIITCYFITKIFFKDVIFRISAFIVIVLGGGFGWIPIIGRSADTQIAGFTFINAFERGHDALSTLFLLLCFSFIYLYAKTNKNKHLILSILFAFLGATIHPPLVALYFALFVFTGIWHVRRYKRFWIPLYSLILLGVFSIDYLFILSNLINNPVFSGIGQTPGFDTFSLITGFGFLSFFIVWALFFYFDDKLETLFIKLFVLIQLIFIFLPLRYSLYFIKGWHVWVVILGFYGIKDFVYKRQLQNIAITFIVITSLFTRLYVLNQIMHPNVNNVFFFLTQSEGDALNFMTKIPHDSGILSLYKLGNYIPAHTDNRVFFGHYQLTPNSAVTLKKALEFYNLLNEKGQRQFLKDNNIDYIYYGLEEKQVRKDNNLSVDNPFAYFPILYSNDAAIVYGIDKNEVR